MPTIHLNHSEASFKTAREKYLLKLTKDDVIELNKMLYLCLDRHASNQDHELEMLILEEIRNVLDKKIYTCSMRTTMKIPRSQARTLFMWMNEITFSHPLHNSLAGRIVDQIYRQMI